MTDPLVSVVMITYNHAAYIAQAIEGVLQQKVSFPLELVIGEDCSIDGTRDIVFDYQKQYPNIIRVITSEKNVGPTKNLYRSGKACRGKYIALCDGDDYWHHPLKLQKQAAYLESHPECGLVYSSYDIYYAKSRKRIKDYIKYRNWEMPETPTIVDVIETKSGMKLGILACTTMVRRTLREQIIESDPYLHQSGHFLRGDMQFVAEFVNKSQVHFIAESLATYNRTEESATRSKDTARLLRLWISDAELGMYLCDKYDLPSSTRKEMEARMCNASLRLAFHTRNAKSADEVRRRKRVFTCKEWLLYYGAKNAPLHYLFRLVAAWRNLVWKVYYEWL